jgi:hypothetical protein
MKMTDVTALSRPIDPDYPTNRAIVALTLLVAVAAAILRLLSEAALSEAALTGATLSESAMAGIQAGFVLFLAWALGRELDPDHDPSAFVGAGIALAALPLLGSPSLLVAFWLLLMLRLVNRTVGLPARPLDSLTLLGLAGWLVWQGHWIAGLVTTIAFLLDGMLPPLLRYHRYVAVLAFFIMLVLAIFHGEMVMESGPTLPVVIAVLLMAGIFLLVIATSGQTQTVGDATGQPLHPRRVQAAQTLALLTALLFAGWDGASGMVTVLPLWAAMTGAGLYRLAILLLARSH